MTSRQPKQKAFLLFAPFISLAFLLLAFYFHTRNPLSLIAAFILGLWFSVIIAFAFVDHRFRVRGAPKPVCYCRRDNLGKAIPKGTPRYLRLSVGWVTLILGFVSLQISAALSLFLLWVGLSYLIACRINYVGEPAIGGVATALLHHPVSTGCSVWCRIDHQALHIPRHLSKP